MNDAPIGFAPAPWAVKLTLVMLGLEALVAAGVGIWIGIEAFKEEGSHLVGTLFLAAMCVGLAVFLTAATRGMARRHPWSRGATIIWQVLQIGLALGTWGGGRGILWLAILILLPALITMLCVFRASVSEWLGWEGTPAAK